MQLDERLQELSKQLEQKRYLQRRLRSLEEQQRALEKKAGVLSGDLAMERDDVERLEGGGVKNLFLRLTGKMDEELDREKAEAAAAEEKHAAAQLALKAVEKELRNARGEMNRMQDCEAEYRRLMAEKESALRSSAVPEAELLLDLRERSGELEERIRELREAQRQGERVLKNTAQAMDYLRKALNWAYADMFSSSVIADISKMVVLNDAETVIKSLPSEINRFCGELRDVSFDVRIELEHDSLLSFADVFIDDIFSCIGQKNRIERGYAAVDQADRKVKEALKSVEVILGDAEADLAELQKKITDAVLKTKA